MHIQESIYSAYIFSFCYVMALLDSVIRYLTQNAPLTPITAQGIFLYDATSLAHLSLGNFAHSSLQPPLKLHLVGWEASVHSHFQISQEMFNRTQVWALSGPL